MGFICDRGLDAKVATLSRLLDDGREQSQRTFQESGICRDLVAEGSGGRQQHGIACWSDRNVKLGRQVMVSWLDSSQGSRVGDDQSRPSPDETSRGEHC